MMSLRWLLLVLPLLVLSACHEDKVEEPQSERGPILPSIGAWIIHSGGGHAAGFAGQDGGDAGLVTLTTNGGRLLRDNGSALPAPGVNVLTPAELDGGVVTYAELAALSPPVVAAMVATFTLAGGDLIVPGDVTLDLGDAPTGTVDTVEIFCSGQIRIAGTVRTRRAGTNGVNLSLNTTIAPSGIAITGLVNTSAEATFDGGQFSASSAGKLWLRGRIDSRGGPATSTTAAGNGGDVGLIAADDLQVRAGAFYLTGGSGGGSGNGGNGSGLAVQVFNASGGYFDWGADLRGGDSGSGTAGNGGSASVDLAGSVTFFAAADASGGASATGPAGDGGSISFAADAATGILLLSSNGGSAAGAPGGEGGNLSASAADINRLVLRAWARGGNGSSAGDGGDAQLFASAIVRNSTLEGWLHGGAASATTGGNGGALGIQATGGSALVHNTVLRAWANGGGGPTAGDGGAVIVEGTLASTAISITDLYVRGDLRGGNGSSGGNGGNVSVAAPSGSLRGLLEVDAAAGNSTAAIGGNGGNISMVIDEGSLDVEVHATLTGGRGSGFSGGQGGSMTLDSAGGGSAGGSCRVKGSVTSIGGQSDTQAGDGGAFFFGAGDAGAVIFSGFTLKANGGTASLGNGGDGGSIDVYSSGPVSVNASLLEAKGGVGGNDGGTGSGGNGGVVDLNSDFGIMQLGGVINVDGGAGRGTGGNGGVIVVDADDDSSNDAGHITISASFTARGGQGFGGGNGGNGGGINLWAVATGGQSGDITVAASLLVSGGIGAVGGAGGNIEVNTDGGNVLVLATIGASAGLSGDDGGIIDIGGMFEPAAIVIGSGARLLADGTGTTGVAGFINLDAVGSAPNPNLVIEPGAVLSTRDGNGTDQSGTNQTLD